MLLTNRFPNENRLGLQEYYCDLTREIDRLLGLSPDQYWKHYILADSTMLKDKCLAIRIPGGTVGGIWEQILLCLQKYVKIKNGQR